MNAVLGIIIACEIGFWILIGLGLLVRYVVRWPRTGVVLLALTPVIDVILLTAVIVNLQSGGTATLFHGLAALYLGISLAYGHEMIKWADARFAYRFANGPAPAKLYGSKYAQESWRNVGRTTVAVGIAAGVLWLLTTLVDDPGRIQVMQGIYPALGIWFVVDLIWAISYSVWPKEQPAIDQGAAEIAREPQESVSDHS